MTRFIILVIIALVVLSVAGLMATRRGAASPARPAPPTAVPPAGSYSGVPNPRFAFSSAEPVTPAAPLLLPAPPAPASVAPETLAAMGIQLPVPLAQPRTDDRILASVRAELDKLPNPPNPPTVQLRPAAGGELRQLAIVGRDDGTQVLVLVPCPGCDAKPLLASTHGTLAVDWLLFICERNYDGCRVLGSSGPGSERVRQAQRGARTVLLPPRANAPAPRIPPPAAELAGR